MLYRLFCHTQTGVHPSQSNFIFLLGGLPTEADTRNINMLEMNFADLVKMKEVKKDDISRYMMNDGHLDVPTKLLQHSTVLEKLSLYDSRLALDYDRKFTDALATNSTLRILDLSGNLIGDEGADRLSDALKVNTTLQKICLHVNAIREDGAKSLAGALTVNKTLQEISLFNNKIGDDGAKHLAEALVVNTALQTIHLAENNIGDEGAESLATSFIINKSLCSVYLGKNEITNKGAQKLADALKHNCTIGALSLWRNDVSSRMEDEIATILSHSRRWVTNDGEKSSLKQLETFIASKIASKDEEIASFKNALKAPLEQLKMIIDTVDLTGGETGRLNKRARTENMPTSSLAIQHELNQNMVRVKQEKNAAETSLRSVQKEKETVEANLEDVRGDLGDANELVEQEALATDIWQRRFDELASLVQAGRADGAAISDIRYRSLAGGS